MTTIKKVPRSQMLRRCHGSELAALLGDRELRDLIANCLGGTVDSLRSLISALQIGSDACKSCLFIWEEEGRAIGYAGYSGDQICWLSVQIRPRRFALARVLLRFVVGMMEQDSWAVVVSSDPGAQAIWAAEGFLPELDVNSRQRILRLIRERKQGMDRRPIGHDLRIRPATITDMPAAAQVHRLSFFSAMPDMPKLHTVTEELAFYTNILFINNDIWIAETTDRFHGHIVFNRRKVEHLYITPLSQGRGLGKVLLGIAQHFSDCLNLWAFQENRRARAFYESLGFQIEKMTNGENNEEKRPDVLYKWRDR